MASLLDTTQPALQAERDRDSPGLRTTNPSVIGSPKADLTNKASTQHTILKALEALQKNYETLQRRSVLKAEWYSRAEEENAKLLEENSELQEENSKLREEKFKLREDKSKLRKELSLQRKDTDTMIDELSQDTIGFREQIRRLRKEIEQLKERQPEDTNLTTQLQEENNIEETTEPTEAAAKRQRSNRGLKPDTSLTPVSMNQAITSTQEGPSSLSSQAQGLSQTTDASPVPGPLKRAYAQVVQEVSFKPQPLMSLAEMSALPRETPAQAEGRYRLARLELAAQKKAALLAQQTPKKPCSQVTKEAPSVNPSVEEAASSFKTIFKSGVGSATKPPVGTPQPQPRRKSSSQSRQSSGSTNPRNRPISGAKTVPGTSMEPPKQDAKLTSSIDVSKPRPRPKSPEKFRPFANVTTARWSTLKDQDKK